MATEVGQRFGRLTVIHLTREWRGSRFRTVAHCRCDCGTEKKIVSYALGKTTQSCGCIYREKASQINRSHGCTGTPEYRAWKAMIQRCSDPASRSYKDYGARGITVSAEWRQNFQSFLSHIGAKPSPEFTVERIDNERGYEPGNVRWATRLEQGSNKRTNRLIELNGEVKTLSQWARSLGIPIASLWRKLDRGGVPSLPR